MVTAPRDAAPPVSEQIFVWSCVCLFCLCVLPVLSSGDFVHVCCFRSCEVMTVFCVGVYIFLLLLFLFTFASLVSVVLISRLCLFRRRCRVVCAAPKRYDSIRFLVCVFVSLLSA